VSFRSLSAGAAPVVRTASVDGGALRVPLAGLPPGRYAVARAGADLGVVLAVADDASATVAAAAPAPPITKPLAAPSLRERVLSSPAGPWLRRVRRRLRRRLRR
jgi:hypothetical protein